MITDIYQITYGKAARDYSMDLEADQHFFEMYLSDHIDNQVQRMMEGTGQGRESVLEFKEL